MQNTSVANDFIKKFNQLNEENQRCVLAILQALTYAQTIERKEIQEESERGIKVPVP